MCNPNNRAPSLSGFIIVCLMFFSLITSNLYGQNWKKAFDALADPVKGPKYKSQIEKAFIDNSSNVLANYWLSKYSRKTTSSENVYRSWLYINNAINGNSGAITVPSKSDISKILNSPDKQLEKELVSVDSLLWAVLSKESDLNALSLRLEYLEKSKYFEFYKALRNKLESEVAIKNNTLAAYDRFLALYPNALESPDIIARRDVLELDKVKERDFIFAYNEFIAKHPKSAMLKEAVELRDLKSWNLIHNTNDIAELDYFIANYPTSPLLDQAIVARQQVAFNNAVNTNTIEAFQNFINNHALTELIPQAIKLRDALVFAELQKFADCSSYNIFMSGLPFADRAFRAFIDSYKFDVVTRK